MTTPYTTLIQAHELAALMTQNQPLCVLDCSFDLSDPQAGAHQFAEGHIPGARYMHLEEDLSTQIDDPDRQSGGRHPLPSAAECARRLAAKGLCHAMQVVVYDRQGCHYSGRLWWMLKWCGHEAVAVLDGGMPAWLAHGGTVATAPPPPIDPTQRAALEGERATGDFSLQPSKAVLWPVHAVSQQLGSNALTVLDARGAARFRGDTEPLDPFAGHIPGALNHPFTHNFGPDGRFKSPDVLRREWLAALKGHDPAHVVHQCGSGVTATANLLAMELAGLGRGGLFAGSWSEWCTTPGLPRASGPDHSPR